MSEEGKKQKENSMNFITFLVVLTYFCPPPSLREEGGLLNLPSSVRPSVRPCTQLSMYHAPNVAHFVKNTITQYTIKAGDTRATRTLVHIKSMRLQGTYMACRRRK